MTLPTVFVYVSPTYGDPEWFAVQSDDGIGTSMGFDGRSIHAAPDDVRCDSYYLQDKSSPYWRLASIGEVSAALFVSMLGEDSDEI